MGPSSAIRFLAYETYTAALKRSVVLQDGALPTWAKSVAGVSAGLTAGALTYPLDLVNGSTQAQIRTHLMMPQNQEGIARTARRIVSSEGLPAFYKGGTIALLVSIYRLTLVGGSFLRYQLHCLRGL